MPFGAKHETKESMKLNKQTNKKDSAYFFWKQSTWHKTALRFSTLFQVEISKSIMEAHYRGEKTTSFKIWVKAFKNGPSKICGRKPLKNWSDWSA